MPRRKKGARKEGESAGKEQLSFDGLVQRVADRFVVWNAYDNLDLKKAVESNVEWERAHHRLYALGTVVDTVIEEIVSEEGMGSFWEAACRMMREKKQDRMAEQLEVLKPFLEMVPDTANAFQAHEGAATLVKSVVGMKIMETLQQHEGVVMLSLQRFADFWGPRVDFM